MKKIIIYNILILLLPLYLNSQTANTIKNEVNLDSLINSVKILTNEISAPYVGTIRNRFSMNGRKSTAIFLKNKLLEFGLDANLDSYRESGNNVIGFQEGVIYPDSIIIIGAHFDAVDEYWADDNASGTSAVIEAARILSKYEFKYSIIYAFWDEEELGLIGSDYYAKRAAANNKKILGVINLDMIGYDGDDDGQCEVQYYGYTNLSYPELKNNSLRLLKLLINTHKNNKFELVLLPIGRSYSGSDHASFWSQGFGAIFLSEPYNGDFNPNYHTSDDRLDGFNLDFFHNISGLAITTLFNLAELIDISLLSNEVFIYPNPFADNLELRVRNGDPIGSVSIYDVNSKIIYQTLTNQNKLTIELNVKVGVYFIEVINNEGKRIIRKILKNQM